MKKHPRVAVVPAGAAATMARIVGWGMSEVGSRLHKSPTHLVNQALGRAMRHAGIGPANLDGFLACPSLAEPRFMPAHGLATACGIIPKGDMLVMSIDTGGASPISMLLQAKSLIERGACSSVAVVAGDAVSSMPSQAFLDAADTACELPGALEGCVEGALIAAHLASPKIPHAYSHAAEAHMRVYPKLKRQHLAMVSVLMSHQGSKHALAASQSTLKLEEVLASPLVAPHTSQLECARRFDGAAALIVSSDSLAANSIAPGPHITGGGEASGAAFLPAGVEDTLRCMGGGGDAFRKAYEEAGCTGKDIDWFGIYDCYPICFVRGLEAAGLCAQGEGGEYVEAMYKKLVQSGNLSCDEIPINTHGGLLGFGAPWEAPALFSVVEACDQLTGRVQGEQQLSYCNSAVVYGNGGIFSASAVAVLEQKD